MTRGFTAGRLKLGSMLLGSAFAFAISVAIWTGTASAAEGPTELAPPSVSAAPRDGQRVKADKGDWSGQHPVAYSYSWSRCDASGNACSPLPSATHPTRKVVHDDVGYTLRVTVTVSDASGQSSDTSAPSEVVAPVALRKGKAPVVSGSPADGQLLSVGGGTWKGTPPDSFTYEWQSCVRGGACTTIPGADGPSYRAASAQIARRLRVIVTATNDLGSLSVASKRTKPILAGAPVNTAPPSIAGSLQEGQALTADAGQWAGTGPISFTYQWLRCLPVGGGCQEIPGAEQATYTASGLDFASDLAVVVSAANAQGTASATSPETQPILGILPTNTVLPSIAGVLQDGGLLSVASGVWSGTEPIAYSYQWQLCNALGEACKAIEGATGGSLKLDPSEIGKTLEVLVTATNVAGSSTVATPMTGLIAGILPKNTAAPTIGGALKGLQTLTATAGSWSGSEPISFSYQWQLCGVLGNACVDIAKATGASFPIPLLDVGNTLRVLVTATNVAGSTSQPSAVTGLIAGVL
ncbi:MAG TPA: hypothetical protein VMB05_10210 [Solirubrobacteraceae bacterium]|nr:hypothetical protein [Solirubrobacteraceae bacterium]